MNYQNIKTLDRIVVFIILIILLIQIFITNWNSLVLAIIQGILITIFIILEIILFMKRKKG